MRKIIIGLALIAVSGVTNANMIRGAGGITCGRYTTDSAEVKTNTDSWVLGYLSSENLLADQPEFLKDTDAYAIAAAIKLYCQQHPLANLVDAAMDVELQLMMKNAKKR